MTVEEALAKIKELKNYIEDMKIPIGYENDKLFLLSAEEYKRYKDKIPYIKCWWWLRSPGYYDDDAAIVRSGGLIDEYGGIVEDSFGAVRPALKLPEAGVMTEGARVIYKQFPFILIDRGQGLYIAEVPIAFKGFDKESNEYSTSEIRRFLRKWEENREE